MPDLSQKIEDLGLWHGGKKDSISVVNVSYRSALLHCPGAVMFVIIKNIITIGEMFLPLSG